MSAQTAMIPHRVVAIEQRSQYNRLVAILLCWFLGVLGVHRFYVGKWMTGLFFLFTGGGFGLWWLLDLVMLAMGRFRDADHRVLGPPAYVALAPAEPVRALPKPIQKPAEPEFDEALFRDPLEEKFEALEKELSNKR